MSYVARHGTKTTRREDRQKIRNALGPSSDRPPSLLACYNAARRLDRLIEATSSGRIRVRIVEPDGTPVGPGHRLEDWSDW